ncbi:MAG TPA: cytochrome c oxidase subunit I [Thermomicrobiales bacterium]|nr:cytochrome c oxidase subunit I [Thermomicrobiales bacterium]
MATVTQTPVTTLRRPVEKPTGLWSWFTTVDHKRIGMLYGVSAIVFFIIGGLEALVMRLQLMRPNGTVVSAETFNSLFTMHGTTMIFLVVMPLSVAFFNYIVPLQIGARDVAFPRLNAFSYWVFILGGLILNSSWLLGQAPAMGWFAYAPLTEKAFNLDHSVDFWIIGIQILGVATIAGGINFFVTIINLRAPGMSLMRMPIFCWMTLITNVLMLLAFPVLTVALFELLFDRYFATKFFEPAAGGDPLLWQHLFWVFGHPEVYILILPAMGIVSEVIPVFSRKPLFGYPAMVLAAAAIAFLAAGVWAHHMFTTGIGPIASSFFALSTMLIAIPTGVKVFNWIATLYGGSIDLRPPLLFAVGFVAMFIIGGLSGVMHASPPVDTQHQDTYFVVAHFHYVLFGGSMFGLFAGLHYWFPKFTGRMLNDALGKWTFWLMLIGFNVTFFPMHFVGVDGMPRRIYTYPEGMGWDFWNFVETIGSWILAFSVLIFLINAYRSWRYGEVAGNDPWDGATLEWSIPGPPPSFNFAQVPRVTARDAFWVEKRATQAAAEVGLAPRAQTAVAVVDDPVGLGIHMPNPSYYPLVTAVGVALLLGGFLLSPYMLFGFVPVVSVIGIIVTLAGIYGWSFEPAS